MPDIDFTIGPSPARSSAISRFCSSASPMNAKFSGSATSSAPISAARDTSSVARSRFLPRSACEFI